MWNKDCIIFDFILKSNIEVISVHQRYNVNRWMVWLVIGLIAGSVAQTELRCSVGLVY